ncbi:hypothetical protein BFL28_11140 [Sphingomonas turrisvirgatae]|uniref:DUF6680 domain-containing protein n=1 Tax=Sphingomonas turrisvirgatae TaxID=1888892 RepID=A0A1E3M1W4_9SPHN|nr:hypothetical protein BFL28_11140 [Sphingomonas turrisvirgatae]
MQAAASVLTMLAAVAALIIAKRAPKQAARFAEQFRSASAEIEQRRGLQMTVFMALMKCRRELLNQDARGAVNVCDVAFADHPEVLNARRLFLEATLTPGTDAVLTVERYHSLTEAVGRALGYTDRLTAQDMRTGWYPDALYMIDQASIQDAQDKLARREAARQQ